MKHRGAAALSFASGFLSLSQEILWVRLVSVGAHSLPQSFALVLGSYLAGIAYGALIGAWVCRNRTRLLAAAGAVLLLAMVMDCVAPCLFVALVDSVGWVPLVLVLVSLSAALRSVAFPIVHHLGSEASERVGASISNIYFANVMGATLGPIVTGFFLLDVLGLQQAFLVINLLSGVVGLACLVADGSRMALRAGAAALTVAVAALLALPETLMHSLTTAPHGLGSNWRFTPAALGRPNHIIENRQGIIQTYAWPHGDVVYGANVYDGTVNVDAHVLNNGILRAYMLPVLRPQAKRVLVIGLSTGAWARVLTTLPALQEMDIVEINPGYLKLIAQYPEVAPLLHDPRVHIHIDDGRRWLLRHPEQTYDVVLMNTTFHWRSNITLLLSHDFLTIAQQHMAPGALLYFNATDSMDALYTAATLFQHAYSVSNFVLASDQDETPNLKPEVATAHLATLRWPETGKPLFDFSLPADQNVARLVPAIGLVDMPTALSHITRLPEVITDQNMITEYRHGPGLLGKGEQ